MFTAGLMIGAKTTLHTSCCSYSVKVQDHAADQFNFASPAKLALFHQILKQQQGKRQQQQQQQQQQPQPQPQPQPSNQASNQPTNQPNKQTNKQRLCRVQTCLVTSQTTHWKKAVHKDPVLEMQWSSW